MAAATKLVVYGLLGLWTSIVLFPLYWVDRHLGKTADPGVERPGLSALRRLHAVAACLEVYLRRHRARHIPALSELADRRDLLDLFGHDRGSLAAYALSRFSFRPRLLTITVFILGVVATIVAVAALGVDWRLAAATALALVVIAARAFRKAPSPSLGNSDMLFWMISQRIMPPVVAAIPIYVMFQQTRPAGHACRADPHLHDRQPADRGVADV